MCGFRMEESEAPSRERHASTVGAFEAKTHLSQLLGRVMKGGRITSTRHGLRVAEPVPAACRAKPDVKKAVEEMKRLRDEPGPTPGPELTIRGMIEEGPRF